MLNSKFDCQIWFPGPVGWELWLIDKGHSGIIRRKSVGEVLDFDDRPSALKILALPTTLQVAFPFYSSAMDANQLEQAASLYVEKQGSNFDADGVMVEAIAGDPPKTIARIDAPLRSAGLQKLNINSGCNEMPDIIVPAPTLLPLKRNSVSIWEELGNKVVAFERNGRTVYYDKLSASGPDLVSELSRLQFQLASDGFIESTEILSLWSENVVESFDEKISVVRRVEDRPAPIPVSRSYSLKPVWFREEIARQLEVSRKWRRTNFTALALGTVGVVLCACFLSGYLRTKKLKAEIARISPDAERIESIKSHWDEVATGVDPDASCLEVWKKVFNLPSLSLVEVNKMGITREAIEVTGTAPSASRALQFIDDISSEPSLMAYTWEYEPPGVEQDGTAIFTVRGVK